MGNEKLGCFGQILGLEAFTLHKFRLRNAVMHLLFLSGLERVVFYYFLLLGSIFGFLLRSCLGWGSRDWPLILCFVRLCV